MKNLKSTQLSLVVPAYNEEKSIPIFYDEVIKIINKIKENLDVNLTYEMIFVDDGSKDNTVEVVKELNKKDKNVKLVKFSRNFGKEAGILAGLKFSKGKAVVLMDADLQDPPYLIEKMYEIWSKNQAKIIYAKRKDRTGESFMKSKFSEAFYKIANFLSDVKIESGVRDFRLMDRCVIDEIIKMDEYHRFSKMIFAWVGFKHVCLEYDYKPRVAGESAWSFWGLFKYAIEGIISFSTTPLKLAFIVGLIISLFSGFYGLYIIFDTLINGNDVKGYPSLVSIILFLGGVQLMFLGIFGQYLARVYEEVKKRPHYIVENTLGLKDDNLNSGENE